MRYNNPIAELVTKTGRADEAGYVGYGLDEG